MHKVCFIEMAYVTGPIVMQRLKDELESLIGQEDQIEFWFTGCNYYFECAALLFILSLKEKYPDKEIDIVAVADPVKMDNLSKDGFDEEYEGFPPGAVTRVEYAPRIVGKSEANYHKRFIEHSRKIDRWMMEQCDTLIAFRYDNIPDAVNTEVDRIKKRTAINVITIFDPNVKKFVDDTIDRMEGREGAILRGLREGKTYQNLGEDFGVSLHRIRQISNRVLRHIFSDVRKNFMRQI